ncbi:MAG TPA: amidase family protein, partial [Actinomycetota bacterium]|nr:amidase family protein [Actinomycetota bacterium]
AAGFEVVSVELRGWAQASKDAMALIAAEAYEANGHLLGSGKLGADVRRRLEGGARTTAAERSRLEIARQSWKGELARAFDAAPLIATPVLSGFPPPLSDPELMYSLRQTPSVNLAGVPALALPVPTEAGFPTSLQLIGPPGSEEVLLATGRVLEPAAG